MSEMVNITKDGKMESKTIYTKLPLGICSDNYLKSIIGKHEYRGANNYQICLNDTKKAFLQNDVNENLNHTYIDFEIRPRYSHGHLKAKGDAWLNELVIERLQVN